jgi:Ankyrin repeats (3 copies)/NACHT domain
LKNQEYIFWRESQKSSLLWITAKAGCGKTTLAAHICQMISTHQTPKALVSQKDKSKWVVLYFFFQKSNHKALKTAPAALRTIVRQLVRQVPAVLPILLKRHDLLSAKGDFEWSWENLSGVLGEMLEQTSLSSGVYIILDALDECEAESRMLILDWMKGLVYENAPSTTFRSFKAILKILVTGRPDGDMIDHLSGSPTLEITDTDTTNDIRALIHSRMEEFAGQRHLKPDITRSIIQFLESNAHGMFLWVVLIMKELERRDERLSDEVIAYKLSSTPLTLMDTYEVILYNVPPTRKQDLWRIVRWLLFGSRSLTLAELETGLCLETGISSWHNFAGDLKFLCGSLTRLDGPREEVGFVHQTARGFLEAFPQNSSIADVGGVDMDTHAANEHLAAICVQYLLRDEMFWELKRLSSRIRTHSAYVDMIQDFLGRYLLLRYAIESWAFHIRAAGTPSSAISTMVRILLSSQTRRDGIMRLTYFINKQGSWNVPVGQTPLHFAVYFSVPWLAQMYISKNRSSVYATTATNDTPLIWASEMGSTECVKDLLDAGADPNEFEVDGWSALHWAARNGHLGVATLLLERGASLGQRDGRGHTPLDWAIDREHWDVVSVLKRWSDKDELGRLDSTSQLQSMHATRYTRQLWDHRP